MIGSTVGNYRLVEKLGEGGMGTVYRALDVMLDREVAVKALRPELMRQAGLLERFRTEARALAMLNHPNIATIHGLEQRDDQLFMIMEFVKGETLEKIVERSGRLAWTRVADLACRVLDALDHAHDMGIVHRDVKPSNIMLTRGGTVKVMDFGIARVKGKQRQTQFGHAVGTPMYMAPEQLRGQEVDGRADVYALGAVLFELTTGRVPFQADSDYDLMMKQLNEPPPPPSSLIPEIPGAFDAIVARAMEKAPENRFPNAPTFRRALEEALAKVPSGERNVAVSMPATRLASDAVTPASPVVVAPSSPVPPAATPSGELAATRLAPDVPAETRLASVADAGSMAVPSSPPWQSPPSPTSGVSGSLSSSPAATKPRSVWFSDWRTWASAAGLIVALAIAVRTWGAGESAPPNAPDTATAASTFAAASVEATSTTAPQVVSVEQQENPSPQPVNPDLIVKSPIAPPVTNPPSRSKDAPAKATPPKNDQRRSSSPEQKGDQRPHVQVAETPTTTTPPPADSRQSPPPDATPVVSSNNDESSPAAAARAVDRGVDQCVEALQNAATMSRLFRGDDDNRTRLGRVFGELGGEIGRVERGSVSGLDGAQAEARFSVAISWRSSFGAKRNRSVPFLATFTRDDGSWRLTGCRVVGRADVG